MNKNEWFIENGFNTEGITYCIIGDTYSNKQYLKNNKCKYSPLLKWHLDHIIVLPNNCNIIPINFYDIYEWNDKLEQPLLFKNAKEIIINKLNIYTQKNYKFLGEIGKRIFDLQVTYKYDNNFISKSGQFTYIYTFETQDNKIIWFTTKKIELNINEDFLLTGTVMQHQNYKGDNVTIVSRCIIKKLN